MSDPTGVSRAPCPRCAAWPAAGDRFCTTCGSALPGPDRAAPHTRRILLPIVIAVIGIVGIAIIGLLVWPRGAEDEIARESSGPSSTTVPSPSAQVETAAGTPFGSSLESADVLCAAGELDCLRLTVPADHRDPDEGEPIEVLFGRHEADPEARMGTLVVATGGPGSSGIELAQAILPGFPDAVLDRYDIVFFEQRGVGDSASIACADADRVPPALAELAATDFDASVAAASDWVEGCLAEAGVEAPSVLERYSTYQAAADVDAYLDHIGAGQVVLYGESYGTQLVQLYAAHRPERVDGLILDAVVDPSIDSIDAAFEQAAAFSDVLDRVFEECDETSLCADDFSGSGPAATWDALAARLAAGPLEVDMPSRSGETLTANLSLDELVWTTGNLLYDEFGRALLLRSLASAARDDLRPLVRLASLVSGRDPDTGEPFSTQVESSTSFYGIGCQDFPIDTDPAVARLERGYRDLVEDGARLASMALDALPCLTGFGGDEGGAPPPPSEAEHPVLVLTSTADPATPMAWAESVAGRMRNGFLVVTTDGAHGTFGWGAPCPDDLVKEFLVFGDLPDDERTECDGYLVEPYQPLPLAGPDDYPDVLDALIAVEDAVLALPDYVYWDGSPRRLGCPHGGWMQMTWEGSGDRFELNDCRLLADWPLTGTIDLASDFTTTMTLELPNGEVTYESSADWEVSVKGTIDGQPIELHRDR